MLFNTITNFRVICQSDKSYQRNGQRKLSKHFLLNAGWERTPTRTTTPTPTPTHE